MDNNDVLRRLRYTFDFNDDKMMELFELADEPRSRAQISDWLKQEDDEAFRPMADKQLAIFLNGLIIHNRGKREGPSPIPEERINNNIVLKKLKIALSLQSDDMMLIFQLAGKRIGAHELSAFLRNPKQSQYRPCQDQYLRKFMNGLQKKYRQ